MSSGHKECGCEHRHEHHHDHEHHHEHCCNSGGCSCGHHHHNERKIIDYILLGISALIVLISFIPVISAQKTVLMLILILSALMSGYQSFMKGIKEIIKLKIGEHFLLLIAVSAAFAIGESREAAMVALFFSVGEIFESLADEKSEKSLRKLTEIRPDKANILTENGQHKTVESNELKPGDTIVVLPFERVPADCVVVEGNSFVDTSVITGESLPSEIFEGKEILSGCLNTQGKFTAKVIRPSNLSAASRIVELAKNNVKSKGHSEKFITRFARIYTPSVIVIGVILALIPSLITGEWTKWIKSGLVFIVASCPCALVISIPLGFFSGIGLASKNAIIIKGGKFIERLSKVKAVCLDKTGTLTDGKLTVTQCVTFNGFDVSQVKKYAICAEGSSTHPIATAIKDYCGKIDYVVDKIEEIPGQGTVVQAFGKEILCGSERMLKNKGIIVPQGKYPVYICVDGILAGAFEIESTVRSDSRKTVVNLRKCGVERIVMLTGDNKQAAEYVKEKCGIDECYSELLPEEKTKAFDKVKSEFGITAYAGDGINDVPVIAKSDVGVAMGIGSDAAIETADVVLMSGKISDFARAIQISKSTMSVVYFNMIFALCIKAAVLIMALFGYAFMALAVFADVGVSIIAIINSSRLLAKKYKSK